MFISALDGWEQPNKRPKKGGDKSAVAIVKSGRLLGCVSQDAEPPESASISRKCTRVLGPTRRMRFTRAALRQANIRDNKQPSLGKIQVKLPHQRSPHAVKFEDRFQEETERQERCARGDAWTLAKNTFELKEKAKATFFSPADEWVLPAASTTQPEEREFVVDSGASMHVVSRKDFNSADLETVRVSKSPTTVVEANSEILTKRNMSKKLDLFMTEMLLEDTPAVLSLGKLCEDHGYNYHWTSGQKPHLIRKRQKDRMQHGELRTIRCPWSIDMLFKLIFTYISYIFIAARRNSHGASSINKK